MISVNIVLAALMTQLSDLARTVEADIMPENRNFCVTGTVSYVLVHQEHYCHILVDDGKIGVDVTGTLKQCPKPSPGDIIRLDGMFMPEGAGSVQPQFSRLEILGRANAPAPASGSADEIMSGRYDFRRALLIGEIRDVEPSETNPYWNFLSVIAQGNQYYATIPAHGATMAELSALIGSHVQMDGFPDSHTCSFRFLNERHFKINSIDNVKVLRPTPEDPFADAPSADRLCRLNAKDLSMLERHKAAGRIISIWQSNYALLQMRDGRMAFISFAGKQNLKRGDYAEVAGYPDTDGFTLILSRAQSRLLDNEPFEEPAVITLSEQDVAKTLSGEIPETPLRQGTRFSVTGNVAAFSEMQRSQKTFPLSIGGVMLEVDFSSVSDVEKIIGHGYKVKVSGTCVHTSENKSIAAGGTHLNGMRLIMDKTGDLDVISKPAWWTPQKLTVVLSIVVFALAGTLFWNRELRKLSEKRGQELFQERSASALAELKTAERTRLAAEIHDTISQILTGAAMQLDAGETQAAKRILASCRRELRCCLWDLRSHALDAETFSDAIRETLAPHIGTCRLLIDFTVSPEGLSEAMRHTALSIIREAAVNAIRHGRAKTISVSGERKDSRLSFSVIDDGKGFDTATVRGSNEGHFGILGMRERAKAFGGSITITSTPGIGTEVNVTLEESEI